MVRFVGLTVNATPLQLTELIAVITAVGLIVTVNVNVDPIQVPVIGVTVYVAVLAIFVVFVKPPLILDTATPCEAPPVNPFLLVLSTYIRFLLALLHLIHP